MQRIMTYLFVVFVFACLWQSQSIISNTIQVVIVREEEALENSSLFGYVPLENITDGLNVNFTVLESGGESYKGMLDKFCKVVKNTGVSVIISEDTSSHPKLLDVYASCVAIPVIRLFHSAYERQVVEQEESTVLHLDPDPSSKLVIIDEILKKYKRNDRVVVVSHEKQSDWAFKLLELLRSTSSSINDVFLNLTITKNYYEILSIMLALNIRTVVLSLKQNLALDLMSVAEEFGFVDIDCIWILEHPLDGNRQIPLLGKLLGIRLSQDHFNDNRSHTWRNALMKDSIKILEKTLQNISNTDFEISSLPEDCRSSNRWLLGKSLYRAMENVQFEGNTGWIQFNDQGYRTNAEYDIDYWCKDENGTTIRMLLAEFHNNKLTVNHTGWPPVEKTLDVLELKLAKNIPLRISVYLQEPYVIMNKNPAQNDSDETCALGWPCVGLDGTYSCCTGYCIYLLKLLMRDVGFSVRIEVVKDGKYGALNHTTGQWSGLIGEVTRGEADIAVSDLTINEQRSKVVDFTHPYMDAGMAVLVKVARRGKSNWTGFMDPFDAKLWIALIVCINTALLIMWLLERYSPYGRLERGKVLEKSKEYSFDFVQTIWFTWGLVFQTFDVGSKPKSLACRILALSFAFSMLIVITSYTANLAAFLVVEEELLPLNDLGIRDLKLQNPPSDFRIGTTQDSSFERFFQATDDPMMSRIWQHMKHNSVKDFSDAIKQMNTGKLQAFVSDYPTLENFAAKSRDCSFKIVGKSFFQSGFGLAVRKNSSLSTKISQVLIQYEDYDISRTLRHRWFLGQCSSINNDDENAMFARLSIADLSGLFLAICVGVIISLLFFSLEYFKIAFINSSSYIFRQK